MCSCIAFIEIGSDRTLFTLILDVKKSSTSKSKVKLVNLDRKTLSHIQSFRTLETASTVRVSDGQCTLVAPDIAGEVTKAVNQVSTAVESQKAHSSTKQKIADPKHEQHTH
jgi:hypothetical protein